MSIRKFNIDYLLQSGKRINPMDLIINYRLMKAISGNIVVSVYGTTNNLGIVCYGKAYLHKPTALEFNTDIFLLNPKVCTGMWIEIENAEYVEIKNIDATFNEASKSSGRSLTAIILPPVITHEYEAMITAETTSDIYYNLTTDGTEPDDPTIGSPAYTVPIELTPKFYLKAIAHDGTTYSTISSVEWTDA